MKYKKVNVEQGSKEWLNWRKSVITATDCPSILGTSKFQTAYKCWQRKCSLIEEQTCNAAMARGTKLEPEARSLFEFEFGITMTPTVVESKEYEFLGASLDGISDCGKYVLEIKCGGENLYNMALNGEIPAYYVDQMQHQLLVTQAEKCYYYCYNGKEGKCLEVFKDTEFEGKFLPIARQFWKGIACFEPPALAPSDYLDMNDNLSWLKYATMYQEIDASIKSLEDRKDYVRKKLIELCGDNSCQGSGVKVISTLMKGRVDYEAIPEIKAIDLNKYRKGSTKTWKVLIDK
jgi:putative phage-type endonuclease